MHCRPYIVWLGTTKPFLASTYSRRSKCSTASVCLWLCVSVCPQHNSKTNDPKVFKLGVRNDLQISYKWYDFRSKVKSKWHRVAKCKNVLKVIERLTWVCSSVECQPSSLFITFLLARQSLRITQLCLCIWCNHSTANIQCSIFAGEFDVTLALMHCHLHCIIYSYKF